MFGQHAVGIPNGTTENRHQRRGTRADFPRYAGTKPAKRRSVHNESSKWNAAAGNWSAVCAFGR
jgi:hypothetical protein